jgi:hypothetical protein
MLKNFSLPAVTPAQSLKRTILGMCHYLGGKEMPVLRIAEDGQRIGIKHSGLGAVKATILLDKAAHLYGDTDVMLMIGGTATCLDSEGWAVNEEYTHDGAAITSSFLSALQQTGDLNKAIEACNEYASLFN